MSHAVRARVDAVVTRTLLVDGRACAIAVELPTTRGARRRGLLGRDRCDGVLVLVPCRQVHTLRMRFPVDVAFCAADGRVLHCATLAPGRVSRPVWRARFVLEAGAGVLAGIGVVPGVTAVVREHAGRES